MLEELEEHVLAPLDVVENGNDGRLARDCLEELAERPRDLVRRRRAALAEQRGECLSGSRIELDPHPVLFELFQHLDDRPVRDPFPVREAASAHNRRLDAGQELRDEA